MKLLGSIKKKRNENINSEKQCCSEVVLHGSSVSSL